MGPPPTSLWAGLTVPVPAVEVTAFFYTRPREGTRLGSPARKYALGLSPSVGRTEAGEAARCSSRSPAWRIRLHLSPRTRTAALAQNRTFWGPTALSS